jgi:hypothetical protein
MSPQPHAEPADEEPSCSTRSPVENPEWNGHFREMLSSFSHRCRNSLNGIKMSLYLFKREVGEPMPRGWGELERSYQQLEVLFDRLQMIYRPLSLTLVRSPLGRFVDERLPCWRSGFSVRGRTLELARPADDLPGDFDPMFLGLGLDAFVAWRAESGQANAKTVLSWRIADGSLEFRWEERRPANGSLTQASENEHINGSGQYGWIDSLAHVLLKRIVSAHGGSLETKCDPTFIATIRWPRFQVCEPEKRGLAGDPMGRSRVIPRVGGSS